MPKKMIGLVVKAEKNQGLLPQNGEIIFQ